jgi:hypothetical protein
MVGSATAIIDGKLGPDVAFIPRRAPQSAPVTSPTKIGGTALRDPQIFFLNCHGYGGQVVDLVNATCGEDCPRCVFFFPQVGTETQDMGAKGHEIHTEILEVEAGADIHAKIAGRLDRGLPERSHEILGEMGEHGCGSMSELVVKGRVERKLLRLEAPWRREDEMRDARLPQTVVPLAQIGACKVGSGETVLDIPAVGFGNHEVLDLHPSFSSFTAQFLGLLLDTPDLMVIALHDDAVLGTILRFAQLTGTEGQQITQVPEHFHAGFENFHRSFRSLDLHANKLTNRGDKDGPAPSLFNEGKGFLLVVQLGKYVRKTT